MNEYGYDDFYEPSEFDQEIEELKDRLRESVKKEILEELEQLRKDKDELDLLKMEFEERVRAAREDYRRKEVEAQRAIDNAKRTRFQELVSAVAPRGWMVDWNNAYPPKCDQCDADRYRHFTSPMGRDMKEECACRKLITKYLVKEAPLLCVRYRDNGISQVSYLIKRGAEPYFENSAHVVCDEKPFEEIRKYDALFIDKDRATQYVAWLNEQEGER